MRTAALRSQPGNRSAGGVRLYRFLVAFALVTLVALPASAQVPPDSVILRMVRDRIESGNGVGAVVGVVAADGGTRVIAWQKPDVAGPRLNRETVFEIGSITKVFTTITLAEMAERGELRLDDPVQKFLPPDVRMPMRDNDTIRLRHIARQNSGLPRLPNNLVPRNMLDPYADYTVASLYAFLAGYTPIRAPGSQYEYSNVAMGLLGHVLTLRADISYEALVTERILAPLDMTSTGITLDASMSARLAPGHGQNGSAVPNWHLPTLAGAGALRSTVEDMMKFVEANLRPDAGTTLGRAIIASHEGRFPTGNAGTSVALGWHVTDRDGTEIIWHNGGTGGYRSIVAMNREAGTGIVILTNAVLSLDALALELISTAPARAR